LNDVTRSTQILRISDDDSKDDRDDDEDDESVSVQTISPVLDDLQVVADGPMSNTPPQIQTVGRSGILSLDDFVADDGIENSFLDDFGGANADPTTSTFNDLESDSDDDPNPMVAADQEDLNPEDLSVTPRPSKLAPTSVPESTTAVLVTKSVLDEAMSKTDEVSTNQESTRTLLTTTTTTAASASTSTTTVLPDRQSLSSLPSVEAENAIEEDSNARDAFHEADDHKIAGDDELESWLGNDEEERLEARAKSASTLGSLDAANQSSTAPVTPGPTDHLQSFVVPLTVDDFNFLETQSGVSSADGEADKKRDRGAMILTPSSSVCDISESSDRSAESKRKSKKKKKETEEDSVESHKKKKKHREKDEEESGGKKRGKSSKKTSKKSSKEDKPVLDLLGATTESPVGGDYELI